MNRFRLLLSGQALSTLGDILYILALVTTLYRQSGSAAVAALFPLLRVIGMTAGSLGAPLVLGTFRLSGLLTGCLLGQAGGLAALAVYLEVAGMGSAHPGWLTSGVFLLSVLEGIAGPARSALLPRMVEKERLLKANGALGAVIETCSLAGWTFGAIVVAQTGADISLWTSAALLLMSGAAAIVMGEPPVGSAESAPQSHEPAGERRGKLLLAGWRTLLSVPALRLVVWMDVWEGLFASAFAGALLLVFAERQLHVGETWWGWMNGAFCAGLIVANLIIGKTMKDVRGRLPLLLLAGGIGLAASVTGFAFTVWPLAALAVMLLIGIAESAKGLASRTLLQLATPLPDMPSVFAAQSAIVTSLYGVSLLLTGWLADRYGIQVIYVCAAAGYGISVLGALLRRQSIRKVIVGEKDVHT